MSDGVTQRIERAVTVLTGVMVTVWGLQFTLVAFSGGTFPAPADNWQSNGSWLLGAILLVYVYPLVTGAACLAAITLTGWVLRPSGRREHQPPSLDVPASTSHAEPQHHTVAVPTTPG